MPFLLRLFGGLFALFSVCFALICLSILLDEDSENQVVYAGLIGLCAALAFLGIRMVRSGGARRGEEREKEILKIAAARGGQLTAEMVALETDLNLAQAKARLDQLCQQGSAQPDVDDQGRMVYHFPGLSNG